MSINNKVITANDLAAVLDEVLPSAPSEYRKLLWTNPNPSSAFTAQTISLDLSNYDAVDIEVWLTNPGMTSTRRTTVGFQGEAGGLGSTGTPYTRNANVLVNGITFTAGKSGSTENNSYAIPYRIYGISYERVSPPQIDAFDYVVDQGVSGIWTYRKWASGIAECWGIYTHSVTSWNAWGNLYESLPPAYATYPTDLFTSTPLVMIVNATTTNGICGIELYQGTPSKDQTPNFYFLRPLTGSDLTGYANIYAKGRWK